MVLEQFAMSLLTHVTIISAFKNQGSLSTYASQGSLEEENGWDKYDLLNHIMPY